MGKMRKAVEWQCHQCMGEYQDGKVDCEVTYCSLYEWMPYRKLQPDKSFEQWSPRKIGKQGPTIPAKGFGCHD
jgi:hypothetical protein